MPMRMAISAVIGLALARPRTPSVPKRERVSVLFLSYRRPDGEGLAGARDIVHPQDGRPQAGSLDGQPDRRRVAPTGFFDPRQLTNEALARGADQNRIAGGGKPSRAFDQGQVLRHGLAESDPRIDRDPVMGHARCFGGLRTLEQKVADVLDDVAIGRAFVLVL